MPRSVSRRQTPQSPPKPRAEPAPSRRSTRAARHDLYQDAAQVEPESSARSKLQAVVEHDDTIVAAVGSPARDGADEQTDAEFAQLDGLVSRESIDVESLDADDMVNDLSVLDQLSEIVLILAQTYHKDSATSKDEGTISRARVRTQKKLAQLEATMSTYALDSSLIRVDQVRQFFEQHQARATLPATACQDLETILAKANLARFIAILVLNDDLSASKPAMGLIVHLCDVDTFPGPFNSTASPLDAANKSRGTSSRSATRKLALDVLTQRFIVGTLLANQQSRSFEPTSLLRTVFLRHDEDASMAELIEERMRAISQTLATKSKRPINVKALQQAFPWSKFTDSAIIWADGRSAELDRTIAEKEGIKTINQGLHIRPSKFAAATGVSESPAQPAITKKSPNVSGAASKSVQHDEWTDAAQELAIGPLEGEDLSPEEEAARIVTALTAAPNIRQDEYVQDALGSGPREELVTWRVQESESPEIETVETRLSADADHDRDVSQEYDGGETSAAEVDRQPSPDLDGGEGASVFRELQMQNLEARKENLPPAVGAQPLPSRAGNNSRRTRRGREDDHEEEDAVFEQDSRSPKRPRLHAVQPTRLSPGDAASGRRQEPAAQPLDAAGPGVDEEPFLEEEDGEEQEVPTSSAARYEKARRRIDMLAPFVRSTAPLAPPQARRPWSSREIGQLLDLMAEYGSAWAHILKCDARSANPCLQERSNVQLKDKARNMKFDFLKALQPLPPGFNGVSLSKHQCKQLDDMLIPHS